MFLVARNDNYGYLSKPSSFVVLGMTELEMYKYITISENVEECSNRFGLERLFWSFSITENVWLCEARDLNYAGIPDSDRMCSCMFAYKVTMCELNESAMVPLKNITASVTKHHVRYNGTRNSSTEKVYTPYIDMGYLKEKHEKIKTGALDF